MRRPLTVQEYDRQWDLVMAAFRDGRLSAGEASAEVARLARQRVSA